MWKTVVRRLLILIPQLMILSILVFVLAQFMPGDPLRGRFTPDTDAETIQRMRDRYGLDDPLHIRYLNWVSSALQGDFGTSMAHPGRPVTAVIGENMMNTVRLSIVTTILLYLMAIPLGIIAGRKQGKLPDKIILFYTFLALSMPTIVLALILILTLGFNLQWFPRMGSVDVLAAFEGGWTAFVSRMHHLVLPSLTGALLGIVGIIYFLRNEIIDTQTSDFVTTARSKGVPEGRVYSRHILRNSMLPIAGGIGGSITAVFVGSVFIETVFTFNGMGLLFMTSVSGGDWPVANALIMFYAVLGVVGGLLGDIIIMLVDPRIRIK